ncbi:ABC transporter permease [Rhodococcoides corynebacterioides]|uniref:ABC transporter permease n=1 Tax=Rhodococcoides corynebacterioides TaxID=53972 RepID=UPI003AD899B0
MAVESPDLVTLDIVFRIAWIVLAVAVGGSGLSAGSTETMMSVSMGCVKIGETGAAYRCDDRAVDVLGWWNLVGVVALVVVPCLAPAVVASRRVAWSAVAILVALALFGLTRVTETSYLDSLMVGFPVALVGAGLAALQDRREKKSALSA